VNLGLRCQGLILIRQNQNVSTTFPKIWSHNKIGRTPDVAIGESIRFTDAGDSALLARLAEPPAVHRRLGRVFKFNEPFPFHM